MIRAPARSLVAAREFAYWDGDVDDELNQGVMDDSVRPIVEAGLMDFVDWEHQLCTEISLEPTPGHTPGHVSVHIRSADQEALITGDCIHHPCQMTRTDWCSSADFDSAEGLKTRERLLDKYADQDILVIGTHFATPTAGHVKRLEDGGYWLDVGPSR